MKKWTFFRFLLTVWFMLICCSSVSAAQISGADGCVAVPGETAAYPITISSDTGLAAGVLYVECDTTVFSLETDASGAYLVQPGETAAGNWLASHYGDAGWRLAWFDARDRVLNGVLCTLPLRVSDTAAPGDYPIRITCSAENTINAAGEPVACTVRDGSIRVVSAEPTLYTDDSGLIPGTIVEVPVYLRNNPGLLGLHLTFESSAEAALVRDADGNPYITPGPLLKTGTLLQNQYQTDGGQLVWFSSAPMTQDGLLLTVRYRLAASDGGTLSLPVAYTAKNTLNAENRPLPLRVELSDLPAESFALRNMRAAWDDAAGQYCVTGTLPVDWSVNQDELLLAAAAYRDGNRLAAATLSVQCTDGQTFRISLPVRLNPGSADEIRVYVLQKMTLRPLCAPTVLPLAA